MTKNVLWCGVYIMATLVLVACSGQPARGEGQIGFGQLNLPLVTESNGNRYRLDANILISGPDTMWLQTSETEEEVLSRDLATGSYWAYLNWGWSLARDDGNGNFLPVNASLISPQDQQISIFNGTTTTLSYQFETDGASITMGLGALDIRFDVEQIPAACTPFADDCPGGSWCAPSGLTGAPVACILAGSVAIGDACAGPTDCGANATCVSGGDGAICVALCPAAEAGSSCANAGICESVAPDYGLCSTTE